MFFSSRTVDALTADHNILRGELKSLKDTDLSLHERHAAFNRLQPNLTSHCRREEQVIYAYMKASADAELKPMAYEGLQEHTIVDQLIQEMNVEKTTSEVWSARAKVLGVLIEDHLNDEEDIVFPLLKKNLDKMSDDDLFNKYQIPTYENRPPTPPSDLDSSVMVSSTGFMNYPLFSAVMLLFVLAAFNHVDADELKQGGLFVEPGFTYEAGDTSTNYPSPLSNSTGRLEGFGLSARLGFHINEVFFLAADFRYSMPQYKDSSVTYDAKAIATNWGPVVGLQMPNLGMRIWGTYILAGELNPEKSGAFDVKFQSATGYRVGAGFRIAALSLNLEYQQVKYGQTTLEQLGPFAVSSALSGVNPEIKSWIASISFPLQL
jgi:hemerythrin-like domain-containing protein